MQPAGSSALGLGLVMVLAALAGCLGGTPEAEPASAPRDVVDFGDEGEPGGRVFGLVVDEESLPLWGVLVAIVSLQAEVHTGSNGTFEFRNVPAGTYTLVAHRLGYVDEGQRVTVAGEDVRVDIVMRTLQIKDPFHESLNQVAFHQIGAVYVDWVLASVLGNNETCQSCVWRFETTGQPDAMLVEIEGSHTLPSPTGDALYLYFYNATNQLVDPHANRPMPFYKTYEEAEAIKQSSAFRLEILCNYFWVCFNERRDMWATAFYDMKVPEEFSALPKDP